MSAKKVTDDELYTAFMEHQTVAKTLKAVGIQRGSKIRLRITKAISERAAVPAFDPVEMPPVVRPVD